MDHSRLELNHGVCGIMHMYWAADKGTVWRRCADERDEFRLPGVE